MRPSPALLLLAAAAVALTASPRRASAAPVSFLEAAVNGTNGIEGMSRASFSTSSPDGAFLYVAGRGDDSIVVFARDAVSGALDYAGRSTWTGSTLAGGTVPDLDRPTGIALSPDGAHAYATARRSVPGATIVIFQRNGVTGALSFVSSLVNGVGGVSGLENAQSILASDDGGNVYVPGFDANAVIAFARNPTTGALTPLDAEVDGVGGVDGLEAPQKVAESPDGNYLYVASQSRPIVTPGLGGITVFERDGVGALSFVELEQQGAGGVDGLWAPRDVVVSPDGLHVYTANYGRGNEVPPKPGGLAVFARDPVDGRLDFVDSYSDIELDVENPTGVGVSADGALVFLSAQGLVGIYQGSLVVFRRDSVSGTLTPIQRFDDGVAGVDGLAGPLSLHVPADGANVYASSEQDPLVSELRGAVAVFEVPEAGAAAGAGAAALALALLAAQSPSASQSRGRRNSSARRASGVPGAGRQS